MILKRPPHEWIGAFRLLFFSFLLLWPIKKKGLLLINFCPLLGIFDNWDLWPQTPPASLDSVSALHLQLLEEFWYSNICVLLNQFENTLLCIPKFLHTYSNIQSDSSYGSILLLFWPRINSPLKNILCGKYWYSNRNLRLL